MLKKAGLPIAVGLFSTPILRGIPNALEIIGCSLQSKRGGGFDAEWQEIANALQFIRRKNPVIFDIGANFGHWTSGIVSHFKKNGEIPKLTMFEPQEKCWANLESISDNSTKLVKSAVGSCDGDITFYQGSNSEVASAYQRSDFSDIADRVQVSCLAIDTYLSEMSIDNVDYIKMDIEGHEFQAILGAKNSLKRNIIKSISFEFGSANVNSRSFFLDFFNLFKELNYKIYRMGHDGVPIYISNYTRNLEYFNGVANYIASTELPSRFRSI